MAATYSSLVGLAVGGKYEIRRVLGIGGMGVVCEAIHIDLGKKVAIKLIDKTMKESELIVARFRREARALGQIQSEHIVDVFDVGADARVGLYMVMEHLPGEDLQSRLERDKRLDVTTGVMVAHQMARGLEKAHAAGVIHRDLKPANVFLTTRDNGALLVKLLDFGVSKVLNEASGARITGSGAPIGTPLYMSPEQAEGKDDTDGRADIWSLGAVLYEALAGAPPFADRGSYHGTIVGILTSRPKLLHDAAPWVPPELAKVVDAMLVHDRGGRIKNAAMVTKRLLEAFPTVLPDGTGRHTAVIVPTTQAVDATGDTEIFTSQGFKSARDSHPDEDSKRTVPNVSSAPGISDEGLRTGASTPVEMGKGESSSSGDDFRFSTQKLDRPITGGPKTDPLPWLRSASSSASGVAMPGTPPVMEPLAAQDVAPDTQRDELLAVRAERRRWGVVLLIAAVIGTFAVGGFLIGRRENRNAVENAPPTATTPPASASAPAPLAPSAGATTSLAPTASVSSSTAAAPSASAEPATSASAAVTAPRPHRRKPPKPVTPEGEPKPEEPTPPPNPFADPAPAP
ncbi:MAG TPA: serine/threonine-protein kinase [Labilithrix sp.]|nr:serine/threonine-protein kinase [Labilithrix sp.]